MNEERMKSISALMPIGFSPITFIDDLEGIYGINEFGVIYSVRKLSELPIRVNANGDKYCYITKFHGGGKPYLVKHLVAKQFLPNPNNYTEVCIIDGCNGNTHISNLEWRSHKDNVSHNYTAVGRGKVRIRCLNNGLEYASSVEAGELLGLYPSNICLMLKCKIKSTGGYRFEYT